jgi:ribosomal-protein-alanine N-acetyltransferase
MAASMPMHIDMMTERDIVAVAAIEGPTRMDEEQLRAEMLRAWSHLWVTRDEEEGVIAYLIAWHVVDEIHVLNVATKTNWRRQGIGRALLEHVIAYARTAGARHVLLEVRRSNLPAIGLYRALGFFAIGVRTRYYQDDEDAIEMVLALDADTGEIIPHGDEVRLHS